MENSGNEIWAAISKRNSRNAYSWWLFGIWIVLPIVAPMLLRAIGIDITGVSSVERILPSGDKASGFHINLFSVLPLQIPLYVLATYKRVSDTNLNKWFTVFFSIPLINLIMLVWPTKKA